MGTIINLVQGSPEWHEHRRLLRNASESPAVFGISPWVTPYQLWLSKTGRAKQETTVAMRRGTAMEPEARAAYEERTGHVMQPLVLQDGVYSASLDGITLDGGLIVEVKCPMRGRQSQLWQEVEAGQAPGHYGAQIQHQLMVSGAAAAHSVGVRRVGGLAAVGAARRGGDDSDPGGLGRVPDASWTPTHRRRWSMPIRWSGTTQHGLQRLRTTRRPSWRPRHQMRRWIAPRRLWWPWRSMPVSRELV